ncbi:MAG: G-D-S-L family lipolytic protein [Gelidibacter sp.]
MKNIKYLLLSAILVVFTACSDDEYDYTPDAKPLPELTAGSADFSKYVAVGASFTAGYTDGAVFIASQTNSFPNILNKEFSNAGGGTFTQPLMKDNIGGLLFSSNQIANPRLFFNGTGPELLAATPTTEVTSVLSGPFNNMGVPGAKSFHFVAPGYGNLAGVPAGKANPYFARMATSGTTTVIGDAVAQSPTFFTLSEVGGNDVLAYATSGGTGEYQLGNMDPSTYGGNDITDPVVFAAAFEGAVGALTSNGAKGVVTNVPYITSLSHFTTVPHNPVPLDATTAGYLNSAAAYGAYNAGIQQAFAYLVSVNVVTPAAAELEITKRTITFSAAPNNAVVIMDEDLTDLTGINPALVSMRQATADDLLVLPAMAFIGTKADPNNPLSINGVAIPLADKWVLTPEEQLNIKTATDLYNQTIEAVANQYDLAIVDFKSILQTASTTGYTDSKYTFTTKLVTGGLVSLDGIHLTSRGYAVMANAFLKAIDAKYGSNFVAAGVTANAGDYPTNYNEGFR